MGRVDLEGWTLGAAVGAVMAGAVLLLAPEARACPFCDGGELGVNEVRAAVFGDDFWLHLSCTAAPFVIFLAVTALIHFGFPFPGRPAEPAGRQPGEAPAPP